MIDIPIGKALIAVDTERRCSCDECVFARGNKNKHCHFPILPCINRDDGKNVIFKLVDWPKDTRHEKN